MSQNQDSDAWPSEPPTPLCFPSFHRSLPPGPRAFPELQVSVLGQGLPYVRPACPPGLMGCECPDSQGAAVCPQGGSGTGSLCPGRRAADSPLLAHSWAGRLHGSHCSQLNSAPGNAPSARILHPVCPPDAAGDRPPTGSWPPRVGVSRLVWASGQ